MAVAAPPIFEKITVAINTRTEIENKDQIDIKHSSEKRGLCLMKGASETLQNLPYIYHKKTHVVFFVFHFVLLYIFP